MNQKKGVPGRHRRLAVALLALALLPGCAALDEWQRRKIYRPTMVDAPAWQALQAGRPDVEVRSVAVRDEQVQLLRLPAAPGRGRRPITISRLPSRSSSISRSLVSITTSTDSKG